MIISRIAFTILLVSYSFALTLKDLTLAPEVLTTVQSISAEASDAEKQQAKADVLAKLKLLHVNRLQEGTLPESLVQVDWNTVQYLEEASATRIRLIAFIGKISNQAIVTRNKPTLTSVRTENYLTGSARYVAGQMSLDEAKSKARMDLVSKIRVQVSVEQSSEMKQEGKQGTRKFSSQSKSVTELEIEGLDYLEGSESGQSLVIAYIHREDIEKTLTEQGKKATQHYASARNWWKKGQAGLALEHLWEIAKLAKRAPGNLKIDIAGQQIPALALAIDFAKEMIPSLALRAQSPSIHPENSEEYLLPILAYSNNTLLSGGISVLLKDQIQPQSVSTQGRVDVSLPRASGDLLEKVDIIIAPTSCFVSDGLLQDCAPFQLQIPMQVDFSSLVQIQLRIEDLGSQLYRFTLEADHIQVQQVQWDFGDESRDQGVSVLHQYRQNPENPWIRLTLNKKQCLTRPLRSKKGEEIRCEDIGKVKTEAKPVETVALPNPKEDSQPTQCVASTGPAILLSQQSDFPSFVSLADNLKSAGKIRYTKQKSDIQKWYRAYFNTEGELVGFFGPEKNGESFHPETCETLSAWKTLWKGQKLSIIWIEEL